ncbi:MAG: 3'-5' exonuclease, partial [Deferrisomatales bacterium]
MPAPADIRYFVFDVESAADGALVSALRYPGQGLAPVEAVAPYRAELLETPQTDFNPNTNHVPVSVAVAKVTP